MFDLLADSTKRRAMKKALKELDAEYKQAQENTSIVERVYQEPTVSKVSTGYKGKNALNRAETTAVDLKNFRDWRKVNNVKSSQPKYIGNPFTKSKFFDDDDDDGEDIIKPVETKKTAPIKEKPKLSETLKPKYNFVESEESKVDEPVKNDISSVSIIETISKKVDEPVSEKTTSGFTQFEITHKRNQQSIQKFKEMLNKKIEEENNSDSITNVSGSNNNIKIEVVVPESKKIVVKETKPVKKTVNRKPRGKNKRKFDADVISSVDWK